MGNIYLIRHGQPDFPGGKKMCIGRTDLPLSKLGKLQAGLLLPYFKDKQITVFSSPLTRARQTAAMLERPVTILPGLAELDMGQWDGLTFDEIRVRFPELYAARATDKTLPFPDAEDKGAGLARFREAIGQALNSCDGDIVLVTHSGVMELLLGTTEKAPYGSVTTLNENLQCMNFSAVPHPALTPYDCEKLLFSSDTPGNIIAHSWAVMDKALELAQPLLRAGMHLDMDLIRVGALLHDVARLEDLHGQRGGWYFDQLGYPRIAQLIRNHCDLEDMALNEDALIFLADKMTSGTNTVTLEERFAKSWTKCRTAEEQQFHRTRHAAALEIQAIYEAALSASVHYRSGDHFHK